MGEACNEETRENTNANSTSRKLALKQCREATAKKEIADVTGKPENDITPTDIRRTIKHATKSRIRDVLKEVEKIPKSSKTEKDTFRNDQIKKAMKEVMGKDDDEDPTDIEIERFKEDGVQDTVRESIDACNSEARDETDVTVRETKYKACRSQTVRQTMADITGKDSSEITAVNVRRHIKRAAKQRVKDEMKAAAARNSSQTRRRLSQADRDTAVKTAIKEVMGLDNDPSDVDIEKYKLDAVKDSVLETVEACNEESRESTDAETAGRKLALKQCREATAIKEIADITGKSENDITPTDIRRTIKHATKSRIRDVLKEVEKIPKSSKTEKDTFRNDQIKKAMKEVMGKDDDEDPTDIEIERFKEDGVQDTVRESIDACNSEARDETDATVRETKYKACRSQTVRQTMADITGKNSSEITAVNVR